MATRNFNENDLDFAAIENDLVKLVAPKLDLNDVLERLRDRLVAQQQKGVTVAQMRETLATHGIKIGERNLRLYLETGELPRRAALVARGSREVGDKEPDKPF